MMFSSKHFIILALRVIFFDPLLQGFNWDSLSLTFTDDCHCPDRIGFRKSTPVRRVSQGLATFFWKGSGNTFVLACHGLCCNYSWSSLFLIWTSADAEGQLYCTIPFYIRDLSICGFWYMKGILEPIFCRYQGTTVLNSGTVKTARDNRRMGIVIWPVGHSLQTTALGRYSPVLNFFGLKFLMYL